MHFYLVNWNYGCIFVLTIKNRKMKEKTNVTAQDQAGNSSSSITCRFLFIYVDGEYKFMQYVEAENQHEAEQKVEDGWVRVVELVEDLQVVYNGR